MRQVVFSWSFLLFLMMMVIRYVVEYTYLVALLERWLLWDSCSNLLVDRSNSVWSWFILRILSLTFLFQVLCIPLQVFRCGVFFSYWQLRLLQTLFKDARSCQCNDEVPFVMKLSRLFVLASDWNLPPVWHSQALQWSVARLWRELGDLHLLHSLPPARSPDDV